MNISSGVFSVFHFTPAHPVLGYLGPSALYPTDRPSEEKAELEDQGP